jgi:hypothetical protein
LNLEKTARESKRPVGEGAGLARQASLQAGSR